MKPLDPVLIYGFGSFFSGQPRPDSDVDIAYLSRRDVPSLENFRLSQELGTLFSRDVDLIPLKTADAVFRARVLETGRLLYCADERERAEFEMYALSDYARLNEERREILQRVKEDRTIYG